MPNFKEGWLKIRQHNQNKWHRRYCIIDWEKSVLFIAYKVDARYKDWIKLLPSVFINDFESFPYNESNNSNVTNTTIEIVGENSLTIHYLQAETKKDFDSWLLAFKQTAYSRVGGGIFCQSLEDTFKYSRDKTSLVPLIVRQCCEYLLEYGLTFVGLFRVPGKQTAIKELRDTYDRGLPVQLKHTSSAATISSLLKNYLQSLPEPIIPAKYFDKFLEIGSRLKYNEPNDLDHLKQLIETNLSKMRYAILAYLCVFLKKLTDHAHVTKMDTDNLAVAFGNNLIRPTEDLDLYIFKGHSYCLLPLIKALIDHSDYLFSTDCLNQTPDSYEQNNESITKSSGFSSFSSLLSANDCLLPSKSRSASMPLLHITMGSSLTSDNQLDIDDGARQRKVSIDNTIYSKHNRENYYQQTSQKIHSNEEKIQNKFQLENKSNIEQKRFASSELLDNVNNIQRKCQHNPSSMNDILDQPNHASGSKTTLLSLDQNEKNS